MSDLQTHRKEASERLRALFGSRRDAPNWADIGTLVREVDELRSQLVSAKAAVKSCDGEQEHFETWAKSERYDMHEHPLHYLFLDAKTNAARMGWKAALAYAEKHLTDDLQKDSQ